MNIVHCDDFYLAAEVRDLAKLIGISDDVKIEIILEEDYDYDASMSPVKEGEYELVLYEDFFFAAGEEDVLTTIAHELIHLMQYESGRLESNGKDVMVWEGKEYRIDGPVLPSEYYSYPWEIEAYGMEKIYYNQLIEQYEAGNLIMELANV